MGWVIGWVEPLSVVLSVLLFLPSTVRGLGDRPCVPRILGSNLMVCVCNATYCDSVSDPTPPPDGHYVLFTSNQAGLRFHQTSGPFHQAQAPSAVHMTVDRATRHQTVLGFGAAFTDAAGINLNLLSPGTQENLLRSYFSPDGIELNFGRVPIAGSDFSTRPYTYDEVADDSRLVHFNLTREDFALKIPVIQRAVAMSKREVHLLSAAWSAPPWMKTNKDYSGFGFLLPEMFQTWADYHIKFLDEYEKAGLHFWGVSTGNEPTNGVLPVKRFNSLGWTPASQMAWVRDHLGPALRASRHNQTKILAVDDQRFLLPWWLHTLKTDHRASQYVDGVGVHWYWDTLFPASLLDRTHTDFPDKFILATEACVGDKPWDSQKVILGSWARGELYMEDIIQDLNHWVVGWLDWNLVLDTKGGPNWAGNFVDAAIIANASADEFYKQPMFYALGHFAKFLPEGSVRIDLTTKVKRGVQGIGFQTPNDATVIVLHNKKSTDCPVTITDPAKGHINLLLSKKSFQTIVYW